MYWPSSPRCVRTRQNSSFYSFVAIRPTWDRKRTEGSTSLRGGAAPTSTWDSRAHPKSGSRCKKTKDENPETEGGNSGWCSTRHGNRPGTLLWSESFMTSSCRVSYRLLVTGRRTEENDRKRRFRLHSLYSSKVKQGHHRDLMTPVCLIPPSECSFFR